MRAWLWMFLAAALACGAGPGAAADRPDRDDEYARCMSLAQKDPATAFDQANGWRQRGGGFPARHCAATALLGLRQYEQAAMQLEELAGDMTKGEGGLSAETLSQAGQAWLLAGKRERAFAAQSAALKLAPRDVDLLIDRAVTLAEAKNYWEAIDDLNKALQINPRRADAHVLRAAAYRYVDSLELADEDIAAALALDPRNPDALVERGIIKRLRKDDAGARNDWLSVLRAAPASPAAELARDNLARLDIKSP